MPFPDWVPRRAKPGHALSAGWANNRGGTTNGQTTYYLNGVGEYQVDWRYYLADGTNSVRQTTDPQGQVTSTRSFTPWGEVLYQSGQVDLTSGYLGGMLDAATGLIYLGNGQYYDPKTGRFLTRSANPLDTNPYVPWKSDPAGAMIVPLVLLAMVYGRKKKRGKWDQWVVVVVFCIATGMAITACGSGTSTMTPTKIDIILGKLTRIGISPVRTFRKSL